MKETGRLSYVILLYYQDGKAARPPSRRHSAATRKMTPHKIPVLKAGMADFRIVVPLI